MDAVLASLILLAQRLPQACHQAAAWLTAAHADGSRRSRPVPGSHLTYPHQSRQEVTAVAVAEVVDGLEEAAAYAGQLASGPRSGHRPRRPTSPELAIGEGR